MDSSRLLKNLIPTCAPPVHGESFCDWVFGGVELLMTCGLHFRLAGSLGYRQCWCSTSPPGGAVYASVVTTM